MLLKQCFAKFLAESPSLYIIYWKLCSIAMGFKSREIRIIRPEKIVEQLTTRNHCYESKQMQ